MSVTSDCGSNLLELRIMRALEKIGAEDVDDGVERTLALADLEVHVFNYVALTGADPYETIVSAWDWHRVRDEERDSQC